MCHHFLLHCLQNKHIGWLFTVNIFGFIRKEEGEEEEGEEEGVCGRRVLSYLPLFLLGHDTQQGYTDSYREQCTNVFHEQQTGSRGLQFKILTFKKFTVTGTGILLSPSRDTAPNGCDSHRNSEAAQATRAFGF